MNTWLVYLHYGVDKGSKRFVVEAETDEQAWEEAWSHVEYNKIVEPDHPNIERVDVSLIESDEQDPEERPIIERSTFDINLRFTVDFAIPRDTISPHDDLDKMEPHNLERVIKQKINDLFYEDFDLQDILRDVVVEETGFTPETVWMDFIDYEED